MLSLGKRLSAVVSEVAGESLADIGCDHGKVAIKSLLDGKVKKVIACDISAPSLRKAIELADRYKVNNIEFRVGNGLSVINDGEVECAVIAGMGGKEIMSILSRIPQGLQRLVLSPHKNTIELRQFLCDKGIYIRKDYIVKEGSKFYDIIVADIDSGMNSDIDRRQLLLGKNQRGKDFDEYLQLLQQKYNSISQKNSNSQQAKLYREMLDLAQGN